MKEGGGSCCAEVSDGSNQVGQCGGGEVEVVRIRTYAELLGAPPAVEHPACSCSGGQHQNRDNNGPGCADHFGLLLVRAMCGWMGQRREGARSSREVER